MLWAKRRSQLSATESLLATEFSADENETHANDCSAVNNNADKSRRGGEIKRGVVALLRIVELRNLGEINHALTVVQRGAFGVSR